MFFSILVALSCVGSAFSAEWVIDESTRATVLVGIGAASDELAVAASANNGVGAFNQQYDGTQWAKSKIEGGTVMDSAVTKAGVSMVVSMWWTFVSTDNGATYTNTSMTGLSQDVHAFGANNDKFGLVGSWASKKTDGTPGFDATYGVASTADNGETWDVSAPVPDGYPRYGAFPSDETWYVASGMWGDHPSDMTGVLGSRVRIQDGFKIDVTAPKKRVKKSEDEGTGWFGSVAKTTDGGKTWTQVLKTDTMTDYIYFNQISCSSELNCVVVGEGDDGQGGDLTVAYATLDGGNTWSKTDFGTSMVSLVSCTFVNENEMYVAGAAVTGRSLVGQFYKSTDGGLTFNLETTVDNCYPFDVDFGETVGFAACLNSAGSSGAVAIYK